MFGSFFGAWKLFLAFVTFFWRWGAFFGALGTFFGVWELFYVRLLFYVRYLFCRLGTIFGTWELFLESYPKVYRSCLDSTQMCTLL